MAYETYYRIINDQELTERLEVVYQKKDGVPGTVVQEYESTSIILTRNSNIEGKFATVISQELTTHFNILETDTDYWSDFSESQYDTWKCIATLDGMPLFHGYSMPDEGTVPFQDRPYTASIRSTDALGLLKQSPLSDINGVPFESEVTLIEVIAGCLKKTLLDLPIRVYDHVYGEGMFTRYEDFKWDFFSQTKVDYRTFMKDSIEFMSCYEVLEKIFARTYKLFYQDGQFFIKRISLYQFEPDITYYTVYAADLSTAVGFEELGTYGSVGKHELVFPILEDQIKTVKFANKTAKTNYEYVPWPEIPKNNKFERGATMGSIGNVSTFQIDDWTYGAYRNQTPINTALPALPSTIALAYRRSTYNVYGIETERFLVLEGVPDPGSATVPAYGILMSDGIPVLQGDQIDISFQYRASYSVAGETTTTVAMIMIKPSVPNPRNYFLRGRLDSPNGSPLIWQLDFGNGFNDFVRKFYNTGENTSNWANIDIDPPEIPIDGTLYIGFMAAGYTGNQIHVKDFRVEYHPYVAGGFIEVKGEYQTRTQIANYPDNSDTEIFLSTNRHKVFKGALLNGAGIPLNPALYRMGVTEARSWIDLTNIGEFNHYYRRFWHIEGSFKGTKYSPKNDQTNIKLLSLHKTYKMSDITPDERYFMLLTPVDQDLIKGHFRGTFAEVTMIPDTPGAIVETMASLLFRIVTAINSTTEAEWDSAGGAPASGTVAFPPAAVVWPPVPNTINLVINDPNNMTAAASDGGAGNSPSITDIYNYDWGTFRFIQFTLGTDIAIGNTFTFSAYGHDVVITVEGTTVLGSTDGNQLGVSSSFKFKF